MRRAAVIYNPVAGSGQGEELSRRALQLLGAAGWQVERFATDDRSGATAIAGKVSERVDRVVVVGGDGSLRETLAGLGDAMGRVEVGLIPIGNANVVARELGIPLDPEAALAALATPANLQAVPLDIGYANSELFLAVVGIGWDAVAVDYLDRLRRTRLGRIWYRRWADSTYAVVGVLAMLRLRWPRFSVRADGQRLDRVFYGAHVCNCRTYAKGWSMTPDADSRSGWLHYQLRKRSLIPFLVWHLLAAMLRRKAPRFISSYGTARKICVEGERPFGVQVDGDHRGTMQRLELEIRPAAARMLVPRSAG